jgi:hypothetical protein
MHQIRKTNSAAVMHQTVAAAFCYFVAQIRQPNIGSSGWSLHLVNQQQREVHQARHRAAKHHSVRRLLHPDLAQLRSAIEGMSWLAI